MGQMLYVCHSIISQSLLLKNKNCDTLYDLILKSLKRKLIIIFISQRAIVFILLCVLHKYYSFYYYLKQLVIWQIIECDYSLYYIWFCCLLPVL